MRGGDGEGRKKGKKELKEEKMIRTKRTEGQLKG